MIRRYGFFVADEKGNVEEAQVEEGKLREDVRVKRDPGSDCVSGEEPEPDKACTWVGDVGEKECVEDSICNEVIVVRHMELAKHDERRSFIRGVYSLDAGLC